MQPLSQPNNTVMKTAQHLLTATLLAGSALFAQAQTLRYEFTFDDYANDTAAASTGALTGSASLINHPGAGVNTPANLRGSNGGGVSGALGDYALDLSGSSQMGGSGAIGGATAGYGGVAFMTGGASALSNATSFTITGWYNADSTPGNFARLVEMSNTTLYFSTNGTLQATAGVQGQSIGGATTRFTSNDAVFSLTAQWVFFAFTYDGATGAANLFAGTTPDNLASVGGSTLATGTISGSSAGLYIGNTGGTTLYERPFDGLIDNVRVWSDTTGAASALDLIALQGVMAADLGAVPEPSSAAALAGVAALGLVATRRRRSK